MATLPTLPGCGQPATIRIEIYSPAESTTDASLDGSVYACEQHAGDMVSALHAADLNAYRVPGGDGVKRCGEGLDFTGPNPRPLTAPEPVKHPAWCTRDAYCAEEGLHRSAPKTATSSDAVDLIRTWLEKPWTVDHLTVVIELTADGDVHYGYLPVPQARIVVHQIRTLLDEAKR